MSLNQRPRRRVHRYFKSLQWRLLAVCPRHETASVSSAKTKRPVARRFANTEPLFADGPKTKSTIPVRRVRSDRLGLCMVSGGDSCMSFVLKRHHQHWLAWFGGGRINRSLHWRPLTDAIRSNKAKRIPHEARISNHTYRRDQDAAAKILASPMETGPHHVAGRSSRRLSPIPNPIQEGRYARLRTASSLP